MRDLIEMTYKCRLTPVTDCHKCKYYKECRLTPVTDCHKCKYYKECLLSEILDVHTGNAPPILDYPTPTTIIYTEGE